MPVAVNCGTDPLEMLGFSGDSAIVSNTAGLTVSVVDPLTTPIAAPIVAVPVATPVASPAGVIVATALVDDVHATWSVRSCVVSSENVPVAVNGWFSPFGMLGPAGATAIETSAA